MKVNSDRYLRYLPVILIIAISVLVFILLKPYFVDLFVSAILAYLFYLVYKKLKKRFKNENLTSAITTIIIIIIILLPLVLVANLLVKEAIEVYNNIRQEDLLAIDLPKYQDLDIENYFKEGLKIGALYIVDSLSKFVFSIPARILDFFIIVFLTFYLFKDGEKFLENIKSYMPLKQSQKDILFKRMGDVVYAIIYGLVIAAIVQGIAGIIGFFIFGVDNAILLGLVMIVAAMIPFVGSAIIWLPISILKILSGDSFKGIGLLIYGIVIISTVDNIIRPKIIGDRTKIHPVLILLGIFGGIAMFGFIGVVVGPLILAIFLVLLKYYKVDKIEA